MFPPYKYFDKLGTDVAIWLLVAMIVLLEFHRLKDLLVFIFMKLYEFFIQRNAEGL